MRLLPLLAVALALPVSAAKPPQVEYRNDRLTVHAEAAPVADILNEIKSQSGAEVRGEPPAAAPVTIDLEAVPLREALERLIGQQSFTLRYGDQGRLKAIELKGGPQAAPAVTEPEKKAEMTRKEMWDGVGRVLNHMPAIPISGRLAKMLGTDHTDIEMLLRLAGGSQDRSIRIQAWRAAMGALEADVDRRNALIAAVGAMDDAELTAFSRALASMTPDGAEDLAKLVARDTTVPELRSRARDVLRQLRLERTTMAAGS